MSQTIIAHYQDNNNQREMSQKAIARAAEYQAEPIMHQFLTDMGLPVSEQYKSQRSVA
jgi:hypothetical protein